LLSLVLCLYIGRALFNLYPSSGIYLSCLSFILFSYLVYPSLITTTLSIHFSTVQFIVLFSKPNDHLSNLGRNHHHWSTIGDPLSSEIYMTTVVNITAISYPKANWDPPNFLRRPQVFFGDPRLFLWASSPMKIWGLKKVWGHQ